MPYPKWLILSRLEREPASAPTVAREMGLRRDSVWRAIRYFELAGCVRRKARIHPRNRRGQCEILWETVP